MKRPNVNDRIEGWHAYRELFDLLLSEAPEDGAEGKNVNLFLIPEWCFDILHEFLYQFQGFCQFRTATYCAAAKTADEPEKRSANVSDALEVLGQNRDAWAVEKVLSYLQRLVAVGTQKNATVTYRYLAYFSSVTMSRLECLLGDYNASIAALDIIYDSNAELIAVGEDMKTPEDLVNGVFPARLSLTYHSGVSYLMLRRYKDSGAVLGSICLFMQRGFKVCSIIYQPLTCTFDLMRISSHSSLNSSFLQTGQLRKIPGSEQFNKLFDRMIALLAILSHICPTNILDDSIASIVHDKHANNLSKIEAGEEGYEDLFVFACPKFINPAVPDYSQALKPGCESTPYGQDAYKLQVKQFMNEMETHALLRKMHSYMTLYTSIGVEKLASFNDMKVEQFESCLTCFKHKMNQLESSGKIGTAMDIHYHVADNVVHVDEAEKVRRFENFFMKQIQNNDDILRQLEAIKIER